MAVSSEKIALLTELAEEFNDSDDAEIDEGCVFVRPYSKASGGAAQLIVDGWPNPEANGTRPVIWSPAASGWAGIVNERAGAVLAPAGTPFMLTPLVIAMPQPMAEALGWPDTPIGFADIVELANDPEGWASLGHPEWGPFRLGKTNPNYSTSGLNFTIAEYYAATGKSRGLTTEDLNRPEVIEFAENVESAVVHYGDITMTFLNNWFATDVRGTSLTYASAVAVEEKSVIDYNLGNPDGVLSAGETPRDPRVPLVAIYPSEGTLFSDNPFIILDTEWVTPEQKIAAAAFEEYVQRPENQAKVLEFGFRPNNPNVPLADPVSAANGVDPKQPTAELEVPVAGGDWCGSSTRGPSSARRRASCSCSTSRARWASRQPTTRPSSTSPRKRRSARSASSRTPTRSGCGCSAPTSVGTIRTTARSCRWRRSAKTAAELEEQIIAQFPTNGTPLYDVTSKSYAAMLETYDPAKINAIVFLTDGVNDDGNLGDDDDEFDALIAQLQSGSEGASSRPVRVFTISYGDGADEVTLRAIAQATSAAHYDASNPATIQQVFTAVISNF